MSVPKHREAAAARLKDASMRIDVAREGPVIRENQQRWLEALTDYCMALGDIQSFIIRGAAGFPQWPDGLLEAQGFRSWISLLSAVDL
mgnify:CR=1 FL=1